MTHCHVFVLQVEDLIYNLYTVETLTLIVVHSYYRPQRSWGKVIFSQASVILFTGASASVHAGMPPGKETPHKETPLHTACWVIRSTSGRYASYWNAILCQIVVSHIFENKNKRSVWSFTLKSKRRKIVEHPLVFIR